MIGKPKWHRFLREMLPVVACILRNCMENAMPLLLVYFMHV